MRKSNAYWGPETPLSLIGYFSKLHKQLVLVTNERIWNKICGGEQFGLNSAFKHSARVANIKWKTDISWHSPYIRSHPTSICGYKQSTLPDNCNVNEMWPLKLDFSACHRNVLAITIWPCRVWPLPLPLLTQKWTAPLSHPCALSSGLRWVSRQEFLDKSF